MVKIILKRSFVERKLPVSKRPKALGEAGVPPAGVLNPASLGKRLWLD